MLGSGGRDRAGDAEISHHDSSPSSRVSSAADSAMGRPALGVGRGQGREDSRLKPHRRRRPRDRWPPPGVGAGAGNASARADRDAGAARLRRTVAGAGTGSAPSGPARLGSAAFPNRHTHGPLSRGRPRMSTSARSPSAQAHHLAAVRLEVVSGNSSGTIRIERRVDIEV